MRKQTKHQLKSKLKTGPIKKSYIREFGYEKLECDIVENVYPKMDQLREVRKGLGYEKLECDIAEHV